MCEQQLDKRRQSFVTHAGERMVTLVIALIGISPGFKQSGHGLNVSMVGREHEQAVA